MRAVVQRVTSASVTVDGERVGEIGKGLLALVGVAVDDAEDDAESMARKLAGLRIFRDDDGAMNRDVSEAGGSVLVVSQFTLLGDARKGRRPSFIAAARGEAAERLYLRVAEGLRTIGLGVVTGRFGAMMDVALVNDGPVTILLDTKRLF